MEKQVPFQKRANHKLVVLGGVLVAMAVVWFCWGDRVSLGYLATQEAQLRRLQQQSPVLVYGAAFGVYVMVTGLSLPGAAILSLAYAWCFGFWRAFPLISFASTAGATVAFVLSRYLFRDVVEQKFAGRLTGFRQALEREGPFYLFTLRLIPAVPFFCD